MASTLMTVYQAAKMVDPPVCSTCPGRPRVKRLDVAVSEMEHDTIELRFACHGKFERRLVDVTGMYLLDDRLMRDVMDKITAPAFLKNWARCKLVHGPAPTVRIE